MSILTGGMKDAVVEEIHRTNECFWKLKMFIKNQKIFSLLNRLYLSSIFEKLGKPCFNSYNSMVQSDDKFLTYAKLFGYDIPLPKTLSGNTD